MTTDISEQGFEENICTALTSHPCQPSRAHTIAKRPLQRLRRRPASEIYLPNLS